MEKIKLHFTDEALDAIVERADALKLGARGLRAICETMMLEAMYELPSAGVKEFVVDGEYARRQIEKVYAMRGKDTHAKAA
jgi:ATP-dependent Clp protease ATP-binding subunit ClpX